MQHTVNLAFAITMSGWLAAEVFLQVRQLLRSRRTVKTEKGSLGLITLAGVGGTFLAHQVARQLPALSYHLGPVAISLILVAAWAGIAFRLWAIHTLGRFFRGTVHIQEDHQVVTNGPYRWVRHPAYTGLLLAVVPLALTAGNAAAWAVIVLFLGLALLYRIRTEERVLFTALGEPYAAYAARTPRLIPGLW